MKGETKEQRFKRIAERRVQRVLDALRGLSHLSNRRMYQWNDAQLEKIWQAVDKELKACRESFEHSEPDEFRL